MRKGGMGRSVVLAWTMVFLALGAGVCLGHGAEPLPPGFVDVREVIPGIHQDIRYFGPHNFVGEKIDGYMAPKCILTRKAAEALKKVDDDLRAFGFAVKVYDCYRPQKAVDHFVRWAADVNDTRMRQEFYPTVDKRNLFKDGYIAGKSSHTRGSTVDLTIVALPLQEQEQYMPGQKLRECYLPARERFRDNSIDMGTGFDCFDELAHPENGRVGTEQRMRRLLLKTLMERYGFAGYDKEWWHFTLKAEPFPQTYYNFPVR